MSIVTKTGDRGTTSLMYGRRVSKCHPRLEACGAVDELSCAIGVARAALTASPETCNELETIQRDLVQLMGELATAPEDLQRYAADGFSRFGDSFVQRLDGMVDCLEKKGVQFNGWAMSGANTTSAALDMARSVCRRAERAVCALEEKEHSLSPNTIVYLNRLSDLLWLLARQAETPPS